MSPRVSERGSVPSLSRNKRDEDSGQYVKDNGNIGRSPQVGGPGRDYAGPGSDNQTVEKQDAEKSDPVSFRPAAKDGHAIDDYGYEEQMRDKRGSK